MKHGVSTRENDWSGEELKDLGVAKMYEGKNYKNNEIGNKLDKSIKR